MFLWVFLIKPGMLSDNHTRLHYRLHNLLCLPLEPKIKINLLIKGYLSAQKPWLNVFRLFQSLIDFNFPVNKSVINGNFLYHIIIYFTRIIMKIMDCDLLYKLVVNVSLRLFYHTSINTILITVWYCQVGKLQQ